MLLRLTCPKCEKEHTVMLIVNISLTLICGCGESVSLQQLPEGDERRTRPYTVTKKGYGRNYRRSNLSGKEVIK